MNSVSVKSEPNQDFMPLMRALVRAYQAFSAYDANGYRDIDLTVPQADVLFTLGNTDGLTFKEIGNQTLITKGTLTGVIDRMEDKGLAKRVSLSDDRRCTRVVLTAKGTKLFERVFPQQLAYIKERFDRMDAASQKEALLHLRKIREIFS